MGTCVYFLSWEFTYQVARPPMASVTTISSRYPLLNPNMGVTLLQKVACADARVRIVFVPRYSIMKQMIASKPSWIQRERFVTDGAETPEALNSDAPRAARSRRC